MGAMHLYYFGGRNFGDDLNAWLDVGRVSVKG